ncbi:MAG: MBL fold metallo-hydrolase [Candidatus Omnitrophica bacterium]|nr:MBL fold metallo-hydrolase [Candidatus Omnitrophota bacterium]
MILETLVVGPLEVNCYILASQENSGALLIDPGEAAPQIRRMLDAHGLTPTMVINTHGHYDHIGCDDVFGVSVVIHSADSRMLKDPRGNLSALFSLPYQVNAAIREVKEGDRITLEDIQLEVLHIPGHTPGGMALVMRSPRTDIVFTGDSLFCQGIGRTDLEGSSHAQLVDAITQKLLTLPDETVVYPGHGPASTIGSEKKHNPFFL